VNSGRKMCTHVLVAVLTATSTSAKSASVRVVVDELVLRFEIQRAHHLSWEIVASVLASVVALGLVVVVDPSTHLLLLFPPFFQQVF
jgi:hypothetical protein